MWDTTKQAPAYQPPAPPQVQINPPPVYIQAEIYNVPASAVPTYPAVQPVQQNEGWWRRNHKNKPQSNSVGAASLIFVSGGMSMAWKLGFTLPPFTNSHYPLTQHILLSWFIGATIGVVIGAAACNNVSKKLLVGFASILVTICGVLQVSASTSYDVILSSRYLNGIALGLVFPLTFVLLGEEVVKPWRGMNAASVDSMCFSCGIFIQIIYSACWNSDIDNSFSSIQMSGLLNIIYGIIAFIMGYLLIIESPVLYLSRGDEQMAIDSLRRLQRPLTITHETYQQLEEHKQYLAESEQKSFIENAVYGIPALLKLCFYRSFMALGFSYFVNFAFTYSMYIYSKDQLFHYVLYALARWLGPMIAAFILDSRGRKLPMIFGFFICTILAFCIGGIFVNHRNYNDYYAMQTVRYILIVFQFFASTSMVASSAYLSEAFPLAVKPYYVAIVFIVEMLIHIIIISNQDFFVKNIYLVSDYFLALGSLSVVFLGVAIFVMPETKLCSLRECLPMFRRTNNFRN